MIVPLAVAVAVEVGARLYSPRHVHLPVMHSGRKLSTQGYFGRSQVHSGANRAGSNQTPLSAGVGPAAAPVATQGTTYSVEYRPAVPFNIWMLVVSNADAATVAT